MIAACSAALATANRRYGRVGLNLPRRYSAISVDRELTRKCGKGTCGFSSRLVALGIALLLSHPIYADTLIGVLDFTACEINAPNTPATLRAECATLSVPENPEDQNGSSIELHIARLRALGNQSTDDPLTFIAGGPGQAASESFITVASAFNKIRQQRDIYLIDQRGTGRSNALRCAEPEDRQSTPDFDASLSAQDSRECLVSLTADPHWYTTSVAVRDLDQVRQALAINQWNLYGVSYGTRVALHYLRRFPEQVRTVILDAVVPPDISLGANLALDAEQAFNVMLERCQQQAPCNQQFPDLGQRTRALLAELQKKPRTVTFENFTSGRLDTIEFTANHLALTLRMMSYAAHGVSLLPTMLHDAYANDNLAPLARQASLQSTQINSAIARGMHHAVICTEDAPYISLTAAQEEAIAATYLGLDSIAALESTCQPWTPGVLDEDFKEPVASNKPVLIFSGEADPITPPHFGQAVAQTLPRSLHIVNPGQAHVQAWLGCAPAIMARFIETANVDDVDYGCLERLQPPPFFVDANGPEP